MLESFDKLNFIDCYIIYFGPQNERTIIQKISLLFILIMKTRTHLSKYIHGKNHIDIDKYFPG